MSEAKKGEIIYSDIDEKLLAYIIQFIYSGIIQIEPPEIAVELLTLSNKFNIPQLTALCELTISQNFDFQDLDSVLTLAQLADLHRASKLLQLCFYLLVYDFSIKLARKSEAYSFLSQDLIKRLENSEASLLL